MLNIFYKKNAHQWEEDFIKNDIFNKNYYDISINYVYIENNHCEYKNEKNILIFNNCLTNDFIQSLIISLKPIALFYIGDENGKGLQYYSLDKYTQIFYRQYNHQNINYNKNNLQLPLGYVKYFLEGRSSLEIEIKPISKRQYTASFIGTIKSDRIQMCNTFNRRFKNNYISQSDTDWSDPMKQKFLPKDLFNIYNSSVFVINGRGNVSLDCFRIYEAIVAGSIPVVVGNINEINITFNYNNDKPFLIIANNWNEAVDKCDNLLEKIDILQEIQKKNRQWWRRQIFQIQNNIKKLT